jgi:hypothetical protein
VDDQEQAGRPPSGRGRSWIPWGLIAAALLVIVVLIFALIVVFTSWRVPNELGLPVLAIFGVVALIASLSFAAIGFNYVNMSDRTQALGLPQGSVRAVIALSLVVLFAILSVYLFSSLNNSGRIQRDWCLVGTDRVTLANSLRTSEIVSDRAMTTEEIAAHCGLPKTAPDTAGNAAAPEQRFVVSFRDEGDPAGVDFAKQLLILVGTLVTSVASFYFGSKAVSEARDVVLGTNVPPSLTGVDPTALSPGDEQALNVLGRNLNSIKQVQLVSGNNLPISAISVTSNDSRVASRFTIPAGAPTGPWDVVVSDGQGRSDRLAAAVTIKSAPGGAANGKGGNGVSPPPAKPPEDGQPNEPGRASIGPTPGPQVQAAVIAPLRTVVDAVQEAKSNLERLAADPANAVTASDMQAVIARVDAILAKAQPILEGKASASDIGVDVRDATDVLDSLNDMGLPGVLADAIAILKGVGVVAAPAIAGIPGGPVGIAAGVVFGGLQLLQDRQKFIALKSALLKAPFDPTLIPTVPDAVTALAALQASPLMAVLAQTSVDPQTALAVMEAALQRGPDGLPLPADAAAVNILRNGRITSLPPETSPGQLARALDEYRGGLVFAQASKQLTGSVTVPPIASEPARQIDLQSLLDVVSKLATDPKMAVVFERLVAITEQLGRVNFDQATIARAFAVAADLAVKARQTASGSV